MPAHLVAVVDDDGSVTRALMGLLQSARVGVLTYAPTADFIWAG